MAKEIIDLDHAIEAIRTIAPEGVSTDQAEQELREKSSPHPIVNDNWIYRLVVGALGLAVLVIIVGVIILISNGKITGDATVPTIFTALGSGALGALAGLLAPNPRQVG